MNKLQKALRLWTGYGRKSFPSRDDDEIISTFGFKEGKLILKELKDMEKDFYQSKAYQTSKDLIEMSEISKKDFIIMHPEIDSEICNILAWCYTFDYK